MQREKGRTCGVRVAVHSRLLRPTAIVLLLSYKLLSGLRDHPLVPIRPEKAVQSADEVICRQRPSVFYPFDGARNVPLDSGLVRSRSVELQRAKRVSCRQKIA